MMLIRKKSLLAAALTAVLALTGVYAQAQAIDTRMGKLEFNLGMPTKDTREKLYDEMDYQRACQAFLWALPAVGASGWQHAGIFYGRTGDLDMVAFKEPEAVAGILTPSGTVTYVTAFPDLGKTGPLVWEIPAGNFVGIAMDFWQRHLADFGLTGPDKGTGVKLLIVGPGQKAPANTTGYRVIESPTNMAFLAVRILNPDPAVSRAEFEKFRLYAYSQRDKPPAQKHVWAQGKTFFQAQPRGMAYWERVNEIIQREPTDERDRFVVAGLRGLGIVKGQPFKPDARQKKLLEDAAVTGEMMAQVNSFDDRFVGSKYRSETEWRYVIIVVPSQRVASHEQLDERAAYFYEAIGMSPAMITKAPGIGSAYLSVYRDQAGAPLDGGQTYRLRVPPNAPMKQFWALTVYDIDTRALIRNGEKRAEVGSLTSGLKPNADGSVDVYVGPAAPKGFETNWVRSVPGKAWFAYFRLYAPTEAYLDKSWPLPDFEQVK
jgi:hypothetical protein